MDRLTNELGDKAKSVEDVLTYALFPQVATKFFETRGKPQAKEKAAKEVPRKAQPSLQEALESETYKVKVNGTVYEVEVEPLSSGSTVVKRIEEKGVEASPKETSAPTDGFLVKAPLTGVKAPLTGDVLRILCDKGQKVEEKDVLVVLEAMKMETKVYAPKSGTVQDILISVGQKVSTGDSLLTLKS
jgi:oxaloacetate decarboxylase alpha subunit